MKQFELLQEVRSEFFKSKDSKKIRLEEAEKRLKEARTRLVLAKGNYRELIKGELKESKDLSAELRETLDEIATAKEEVQKAETSLEILQELLAEEIDTQVTPIEIVDAFDDYKQQFISEELTDLFLKIAELQKQFKEKMDFFNDQQGQTNGFLRRLEREYGGNSFFAQGINLKQLHGNAYDMDLVYKNSPLQIHFPQN